MREEGYAIARAGPESFRAPVQTLHFYHQTLHLLGARPAAVRAGAPRIGERTAEEGQIEIPLRAASSKLPSFPSVVEEDLHPPFRSHAARMYDST